MQLPLVLRCTPRSAFAAFPSPFQNTAFVPDKKTSGDGTSLLLLPVEMRFLQFTLLYCNDMRRRRVKRFLIGGVFLFTCLCFAEPFLSHAPSVSNRMKMAPRRLRGQPHPLLVQDP